MKNPATAEYPALLRSAGLRATPQRLQILAALAARSRPSSVEDIRAACTGATPDLVTVYRALDQMTKAKLVRTVEARAGRQLFELADAHHHHAVCTSCGVIRDIDSCLPERALTLALRASGFSSFDDHAIELYGTCASCA